MTKEDYEALTASEVWKAIRKADEAYVGERFMGTPDAWYEPVHWWCANGHRSRCYLKSERLGYNACLAGGCRLPVWLGPENLPGIEPK